MIACARLQAAAMTYQQHMKAEQAGEAGVQPTMMSDDMDPKVMRKMIQQQLKKREAVDARRAQRDVASNWHGQTRQAARSKADVAGVAAQSGGSEAPP